MNDSQPEKPDDAPAGSTERVDGDGEYAWVCLRFHEVTHGVEGEDPARFAHEWQGDVLIQDEAGDETVIGHFCATYFDVDGAVTEADSVFDLFDAHAATAEYLVLYDDEQIRFTDAVFKVASGLGTLFYKNLLALDRLIIEPEYRGKGRGLVALRGLIHLLRAGAGLIVMKPFPLQREAHFKSRDNRAERERLQLDTFPGNYRTAVAALRRYYSRLGFKRLPGTDFMVLDPERELPSVDYLRGGSAD